MRLLRIAAVCAFVGGCEPSPPPGVVHVRWPPIERLAWDDRPSGHHDGIRSGARSWLSSRAPSVAIKLYAMHSDAERWRFITQFRLHVSWHSDHVTLMWQRRVEHLEASPPYFPVASGKTLEEATDAAIARYNRKHGLSTAFSVTALAVLEVRGWVS
jgi:hypothetical protein